MGTRCIIAGLEDKTAHVRINQTLFKVSHAIFPLWEFPMGVSTWYVYGEPCYGTEFPVEVNLTFSACNHSEFNCNNGLCVPMEQRCDGQPDCIDKSGTEKEVVVHVGAHTMQVLSALHRRASLPNSAPGRLLPEGGRSPRLGSPSRHRRPQRHGAGGHQPVCHYSAGFEVKI